MNYTIGVDGGGSKTHAVLGDDGGQIVAESFSGPANIKTDPVLAYASISSAINELIQGHNLDASQIKIGIGVAGFSALKARNHLQQLLAKNYPNVMLESDCHVACLAAHAHSDGAVVICGTGVVGYYIKAGVGTQIGGWGFPHGDLGGGAWIGLEICRSLCLAIDGVITHSPMLVEVFARFDNDTQKYKDWLLGAKPSDYAEIAKLLIKYISFDSMDFGLRQNDSREDGNAKRIFVAGIQEISRFIQAVKSQTHGLPIKLTGGLAPFYLPELVNIFPHLALSKNLAAFGASLITEQK